MMDIYYILNLISITIMGGLACVMTNFISGAKHGLYGIIKLLLMVMVGRIILRLTGKEKLSIDKRLVIVGKVELLRHRWKWYKDRPIFMHCILMRFFLVCTTLTMLTIFSKESIFYKPLVVFIISPCLWITTFLVIAYSLRIVSEFYKNDILKKIVD